MSILRAVFSKRFAKNLLYSVLFGIALLGVLYLYLNVYTSHGEQHVVPDVRGIEVARATELLQESTLEMLVVDSVYSEGAQPGLVFEQSPAPFSNVKEGRTVYLTVYRSTPPMEKIGISEGMNERVAEIILQNKGLRYEKQFEDHAYLSGMVIRVLHRGKALSKESTIKRGDRVTLVVGMLSNEKVPIPSLMGLSLDSAVYLLSDRRLTLGAALYEGDIVTAADSAAARVYRQNPAPEANRTITVGTAVDLFLRIGAAPDPADGADDGLFE